MISAIVLAGGYATRLRPLSLTRPKPLLPVLAKPLIDYILDSVERAEISNVFVSLRVMANKIVSHLMKEKRNVIPVIEQERLGDAGPLKLIYNNYKLGDTTVVLNGDVYFETNIKDVVDFHQSKGCDATVVGTKVEDPRRFGVLLTEGYRLVEILEKPKSPPSNLINAGIYVFNSELFRLIEGKSIARDFLTSLLRSNKNVCVYEYDGIWADIGRPEDYRDLNLKLLASRFPRGYIAEGAKVSERAELRAPYFIPERTTVEGEAEVFYSVLGHENVVSSGARVAESVLLDKVNVGKFSTVNSSILGEGVSLGKRCWVESSILGDEVEVYDNVFLNEGTIVLPNKEISEPVFERHKVIL